MQQCCGTRLAITTAILVSTETYEAASSCLVFRLGRVMLLLLSVT